jgi:hypothetical protein
MTEITVSPEEATVLETKVLDAEGKDCPAFSNYVRDKVTVICNQTGGVLVVGVIKNPSGSLILQPGDSYDMEKYARPTAIEYSGINQWIEGGTVTIHHKGSTPVGKAQFAQSGPVGVENDFDRKLDALEDREVEEDERTSRKKGRRTGGKGSVSTAAR